MASMTFTDEQRRAIETVDRSVLVSAAAGSGKTAVLAERCAYLICDAQPPYRCDVDGLLVVTFTEAAAAEMKERIARVLRERCSRSPDDLRLRAQLALVDTAQISTLHAFCLWMVRRWFDRAGVDATAQMLDADEARLLQQEALEAVLDGLYRGDGELAKRFRALVDDYGLGYDGMIADFVLRLAAFVTSLDDPQSWLARARDASPARVQEVLDQMRAALVEELCRQGAHCREIVSVISRCFPAGAFYGTLVGAYAQGVEAWLQRLHAGEPADVVRAEIAAHTLSAKGSPRLARGSPAEVVAERDQARDLYCEVSEKLLKKRLQGQLCKRNTADITQDLMRVAPYQQTLIDLSERFLEQYARMKRSLGVMDFADLERFAYDLLVKDASVRATLRRRFAHVLVDEYQDINPLQAHILAAVSREGDAQSGVGGNLFTVGDVKQSIYRFRLAEPDMFVRRAERLRAGEGGVCIDLQRNYRSRRGILDAVNAVFRPLMCSDRGGIAYDKHAELRAPSQDTPRGVPVEVHVLEREAGVQETNEDDEPRFVDPADPAQWAGVEREGHLIGRRIRELMDAGTRIGDGAAERPLRYGDICVLLRSTKHSAAPLANMLRQMGIPVWTDAGAGLFDAREVRDVLALLAILDNVQQDIPLAAVLRSGILGAAFNEDALAQLKAHDRHAEFHEAVCGYAKRGADTALRDKLRRTLRKIDRLRREMREQPLADVLWSIYRETGYFAQVGGWRNGEQRRANLVALHERARQFGAFRRQGLRRFLRFIESLQKEGEELAAPAGLGEIDNAVRILSIHRAKGLEFPIVIAAELGRQFNLMDTSGRFLYDRRVGVGIKAVDRERLIEYPTALHRWCARSALEASLAEELRVWYVAMTRARERLILVGSEHSKTVSRLRQVAEAGGKAVGPLQLLAARSPLHWLIAAQGTMPTGAVVWEEAGEPHVDTLFACRAHDADAIWSWTLADSAPAATHPLRRAVASLAALPDGEPVSADPGAAQRVVGRLGFVYPHLALSSIPVARAASAAGRLVQGGNAEEPAALFGASEEGRGNGFPLVAGARRVSRTSQIRARRDRTSEIAARRDTAVVRGQAVHKALQFLGLPETGDESSVARELDRLVACGTLSAEEAQLVDACQLTWFFSTELGRRVRAAGDAYRREWMFLASEPPETLDPTVTGDDSDRVLIRGVVDGLLVMPDALEIIDFKTDRVDAGGAESRAADYTAQVCLYARAASEVYRRPVAATHLVFLHGRCIVSRKGPDYR
jgi:ATP-dependent helicase/nuclease subunit A